MDIYLRGLMRTFAVIGVALFTCGAAPGAIAGIAGSGTLDITNGVFAYDSTGSTSFTPLSGPASTYFEFVTGDFAYTNTLPSNSAFFNYQASYAIDVNGGASGGGQTFSQSVDLGYTTFNALTASGDGLAVRDLASSLLGALSTGTYHGSRSITTILFGGPYAFSFAVDPSQLTTTSTSISGPFDLWSTVDYSGPGKNPVGLVFPSSATFTAHLALNAVPEPGTLALLSLGLLTIGLRGRRKATR